MEKLPITSQHLVIAQRIITFVQEQGWDIEQIAIARYDARGNPFVSADEGDDWKGKKLKWSLNLAVAPRDDETVQVPSKEPA